VLKLAVIIALPDIATIVFDAIVFVMIAFRLLVCQFENIEFPIATALIG
jgi:hypothetical protein